MINLLHSTVFSISWQFTLYCLINAFLARAGLPFLRFPFIGLLMTVVEAAGNREPFGQTKVITPYMVMTIFGHCWKNCSQPDLLHCWYNYNCWYFSEGTWGGTMLRPWCILPCKEEYMGCMGWDKCVHCAAIREEGVTIWHSWKNCSQPNLLHCQYMQYVTFTLHTNYSLAQSKKRD